MASTLQAVPLVDALTITLSQAWARLGQRQFAPLARWALTHIDQNGERQNATVDVLEAMPLERLILVRQSPEDDPLVIKIGRIVEATDVPTGRKVRIDQWLSCATTCNHVSVAHASNEALSQGLEAMLLAVPRPWDRPVETSPRR